MSEASQNEQLVMRHAEHGAIVRIDDAVRVLKTLGWREPIYCPKDGKGIEMIEPGSIGIHRGCRDDAGFWVSADNDLYPSDPILWRPIPEGIDPGKEKEADRVARRLGVK